MDVDRIKRGTYLTEKYFDEQLNVFAKFEQVKENFIKKLETFMQLLLIMMKHLLQPTILCNHTK